MPSSPATTAEAAVALDGRPLGKRGAATRRRLLDATARLLESDGVRDLRVVDIAREVGTSPATFYQYFRSVDEAVLVLADELAEELHPVAELLDTPRNGKGGLDAARVCQPPGLCPNRQGTDLRLVGGEAVSRAKRGATNSSGKQRDSQRSSKSGSRRAL